MMYCVGGLEELDRKMCGQMSNDIFTFYIRHLRGSAKRILLLLLEIFAEQPRSRLREIFLD